jgi:hypothetical protein
MMAVPQSQKPAIRVSRGNCSDDSASDGHLCGGFVFWPESFADPLNPYDPAYLCKLPIFPDCFTSRRRISDA